VRRVGWAGIRLRSALAATGVVALTLAVGAAALLWVLQRSLLADVEDVASARCSAVSASVATAGAEAQRSTLPGGVKVGQVVQVVDRRSGQVVASSSERATDAPVSAMRPAPGATRISPHARVPALDPDDRYVVVACGVPTTGGPYVVLVAAPVTAERESVSRLTTYLLLGFPLLLVAAGGATFWFVGRSLLPVERIRRQVAAIGARRLDERVPVPAADDEIRRLAITMNAMLDRLEAASNAQRRFVADASHELRSPLATLRAAVDVSVEDAGATSWRELSPGMRTEVDRMSRLVDDLLLLAKVDEHGLSLDRGDVDLDDVVESEARRVRDLGAVAVSAATQPVRVTGDAAKLAQVVRNLSDNAVRHANGAVRFELALEDGVAVLHVDDDGPGVPAADRDRVFDRFVRLDPSRGRESGGSGLGLAITREIALAHAGRVEAGESPLGGARFTVVLPAAGSAGAAGGENAGQPPVPESR
jgi:signal transduction histidine kinase